MYRVITIIFTYVYKKSTYTNFRGVVKATKIKTLGNLTGKIFSSMSSVRTEW